MNKSLGERLLTPINRVMGGTGRKSDIAYGTHPDMRYDEYPSPDATAPIVIFWFGGSWKTGNKGMYRFIGHWLQAMGAHGFVVDYPKYPDRVFPGFTDDAAAALAHIRAEFPQRRIILMGHSAGANTAMLTAMMATQPVDKVISMAGPCTLAARYWRPVFGEALKTKRHDPRSYVQSSPPQTQYLLVHGRLDHIVRVSDSISLHRLLTESGRTSQLRLIALAGHIDILLICGFGLAFRTRRQIRHFIHS